MQQAHQSYYQPYLSDSDDSDSSSISSSDTSTDGIYPIGSPDGLRQAGAVPETAVSVITNRIQPRTGNSKVGLEYSVYDISGVLNVSSGTKFDTSAGTYTSILMINSLDRDRNVYAQPTFFTIRLPRTYRNVSQFSITQMKLLSSFYYFRPDKENVSLQVLEQGRTLTQGGATVDNIITVTIRTGSYDINALLAELQLQLNRTPLFFYFPNGINDFIPLFTAAGDLSVGFNQPGDNFYNALLGTFIANPTMTQIVTTFFPSANAGLTTYSFGNVLIAYYYPVLYEQVLDPAYIINLNLKLTTSTLLPGETVTSRILYTFQGLNDPVILELINQNIAPLDTYRTLNTFLHSLVNEYKCTYATNNNNISISTNQLNTSLYNLITNQTTIALASQLNANNLTAQQYSNLQASNLRFNAVFTDMYNFIQKAFAVNYAVNFGTYSAAFYTNVNNVLFLQNGIGATGVATGYTLAVLQSGNSQINSSAQQQNSSPGYWPQIHSIPPEHNDLSANIIWIGSGTQYLNRFVDAAYAPLNNRILNTPYNYLNQSMQTGTKFIDNSGNLYINPSFGAGDCVTPIYNSGYTVFRFRSFVRQTLQVETLPLPYYYRIPELNKKEFPGPIATYFDLSYSFINNPFLTRTDISSIPINFAQNYATARSSSRNILLTVQQPIKYYSFVAPYPPVNDASGYKYNLTLTVESETISDISTNFVSPIVGFLYHDQGAFYADISGYRSENPYNYLQTFTADTTVKSVTITANVIAGDTYYMILRSQAISFQNIRAKVIAYYPQGPTTPFARYIPNLNIDPYGVPQLNFPIVTDVSYNKFYGELYDIDYMRLPSFSTLQGKDPTSASFNQYLPVTEFPIGYDSNGVSTDLTDYRGYLSNNPGNRPNVTFRTDPTNQYTFQSLSPYYSASNSYFYTGSLNAILKPLSNTVYTPTAVAQREYKIVHWYDQQYIAPQYFQSTLTKLPSIPTFTSVVDASYGALNGYTYTATTVKASNSTPIRISTAMNFDQGVIGLGFLPSAAQWEIDQVVFKTAYMRNAGGDIFTDPNRAISTLCVFPTSAITGNYLNTITQDQAMYQLNYVSSFQYTPAIEKLYSGFDTIGGTYWQFKINSNFVSPLVQKVGGFTPSNTYLFDSNAYYSIIPFDSNGNVTQFYTLMGSYVPYPNVSKPVPASTVPASVNYYSSPPPNNTDFYVPQQLPSFKPGSYYPTDCNLFQSRYEQSIPIQTNLIHTQKFTDPTTLSNVFKVFTTSPVGTAQGQDTPAQNQLIINNTNSNIGAMTLLINNGPYVFMTDNGSYTSFGGAGNTTYSTKYYFGSNYNQDFGGSYCNGVYTPGNVRAFSNINSNDLVILRYDPVLPVQTTSNLNQTGFQSNLFMGITTNTNTTTFLDNMFVLTLGSVYRYGLPASRTAYAYEFIFSRYNPTISRLNPLIYNPNNTSHSPIFVSSVLSNGTPLAGSSLTQYKWFDSNPNVNQLVNFSYTIDSYTLAQHRSLVKFNYTNTNLLFFQFQTINPNPNANQVAYANFNTSYFCMYDSNTSKIVNFFPTNGFLFPFNTFNNTYFSQFIQDVSASYANTSFIGDPFNAQVRNGPIPTNLYLDWTVDTTGNMFVMNLPSDYSQYFNISYYKLLSNQGGAYPTQLNFNTGIRIVGSLGLNNPTYHDYGYGFFNQLKIDANSNLYMQQQFDIVSQNSNIPWSYAVSLNLEVVNPYHSYPQLLYAWNIFGTNDLWGRYAKINLSQYGTLVTNSPPATVIDLQFAVSQQNILSSNSCNTSTAIISDMILGNQQGTGGTPSLFFQRGQFENIYNSHNAPLNAPMQLINLAVPPDLAYYTCNAPTYASGPLFLTFSYQNQSYTFQYQVDGDTKDLPVKFSEYTSTIYGLSNVSIPYFITTAVGRYGSQYSYLGRPGTFTIFLEANYLFTVRSEVVLDAVPISAIGIQWPIAFSPPGPDLSPIPVVFFPPSITNAPWQLTAYGFANSGIDLLPLTACNAWQVMYPSVKIVMKKLSSSASPITNVADLTKYPSYSHTSMFYYDNYSDLSNDIFDKFGSETKARFKNSDVSSGYEFYSYMYNIPLEAYKGKTNDISDNIGYNYVAIRGYSPTEKFNCLTRFYLPNQYSFGFLKLSDISNETLTVLQDLSNSPLVNQTYLKTLAAFNATFVGNFTFGSNVIPGFPGSNYTFNGFGSFLAKYISIYNQNLATATLLGTINSNVTKAVSAYINYYLTPILPSYVLTRARFTDPLLFSFLFKSALTPQYAQLEDEWGLGWNLGYPKMDTPYNTIQKAPSFFKILDDYIFLKLNKEFTMNRMDSSAKENLAITHEPQGQTNQYAAKLLLAGFGGYAQTMVQNPITFNPVLTSLDKLTFQWVDATDTQINNANCEWNAVVQINEQVTQATLTSTIPKAN